jgi:thymidine phosphorylase
MFLPQDVIRRKRDREELPPSQIREFINGVVQGTVNQGQIGAFTMAVYLNGMSVAERVALTLAMRDSGTVLDWRPLLADGGKVIEKHSSGGVGDEKVTLMVLPIVAACGVFAPNISGRSLGHTGGELDLLESIPGYNIEPTNEVVLKTVSEVGMAIIGPTADLAPADRTIFHVRDVTSTVESIPLIVSSILSKKLAAGPDGMVMTVPFGSGAFMREEADAVRLAKALVEVGEAAGLPIVTLVSDLEQVLGDAVGNALQIFEVIAFLKGTKREARVREVVLTIAAEMVVLAGVAPDMAAALALAEAKLADGSAAERFGAMVAALGGPADLMLNPDRHLDKAEVVAPVFSLSSGFVQRMDCWVIGMALVAMGAGRTNPEDKIDYAVGISQTAHLGDEVSEEVPLCMLHARSQKQWEQAATAILEAFAVGAQPLTPPPVFRQRFASC